jgi:two-component system, CitB family, response regulator DctR
MIVDDDPMVLHVNRFFVEEMDGFKVVGTARTGSEAVETARRLQPELILLDIYMPDKDGLTALRELRAQGVASDVILVSAAADPNTIEDALRAGAHDYVIKPFRPERLRTALESYRMVKRKLSRHVRLSQEDLDRLWRSPAAGLGDEVPKGLNEMTLQQIVTHLAQQTEPQTAGEIGDALGMARVTARRYLDYLVKLGQVKLEMQYGGVGRPTNRYCLTRS